MHTERDPRQNAIPDIHGHAKGEHKLYAEERPLPLTARMLFLWFYHACRRGFPRFMMVTDHMNALTFEDPASVNLVRRALKLAQAGDLYGAAETANVDVGHAQVVSEGLRRGMRYSIGAEVDNDPRARPDAQNIVEAMKPDGLIRSVHFIPIDHPVHGAGWSWPFDNPEFVALYEHVGTEKTWEIYMGVLLDALERLPGHIVGHFYVPAIFGNWPDLETLEKYEDQMLDIVEQKGMAVEFNTRFLYRDHTAEEKQRYLDANKRMLRKAKERGVGIAIGSDAHSPRDQGGAFDTVLAVLDELDINEIVFPIGGRLLRVALRYVKPPEPEPVPPPPPPPAPEPVPVSAAPAVAEGETADAPAKPVRKARPAASSTRPKESAPERSADEKPFVPPAVEPDAAPEAELAPAPAPVKKPRPSRAKAAPPAPEPVIPEPVAPVAEVPAVVAAAPDPDPVPDPAPLPVPLVVKAAPAKPAPKAAAAAPPAAKAVVAPKPGPAKSVSANAPPVKSPVKAPAKPVPAKAPVKIAPAKAKKAPVTAASKRAPVKAAPAKKAVAKKPVAPVKKAASKKSAPKKAATVKKAAPPKKAAPAKKAPPKKAPPKKAPAKKPAPPKKGASKAKAPAKKATAKKAAKRR